MFCSVFLLQTSMGCASSTCLTSCIGRHLRCLQLVICDMIVVEEEVAWRRGAQVGSCIWGMGSGGPHLWHSLIIGQLA